MDQAKKKSIIKQLLLTLWAMGTLVLCFVLVLLVYEMLQSGQDPLTAFTPESEDWPEAHDMESWRLGPQGTRDIALYFVDNSGHWLATENASVAYSGRTVENCRAALERLLAGPAGDNLFPLLPEQTRLRALYLRDDGELIVDISSEALGSQQRPKSAEMEALMAYGIVNTLAQPALQGEDERTVGTVRFLFDGATPQDAFPAHIDLTAPLVPDRRWIQTRSE